MSSRNVRPSRLSFRTCMAGVAALTVAAGIAWGDPAVPYADSFESYTNQTALPDTPNGWYSANPTGAVVRSMTYSFPLRRPLTVASPTNVVELYEAVTNKLVHAPGADTNIWVDVMVMPVRSSAFPEVDDNDIQTALFFNTNGHIVVRHAYYDDSTGVHHIWSELAHPAIPTGKWARVTLQMNYLSGCYLVDGVPYEDEFGVAIDRYFRVSLNGSDFLTNRWAVPSLPVNLGTGDNPTMPRNGSWFMMCNSRVLYSDTDRGLTNINSVAIQGTGYFDDYVVTNGDVFASVGTRWLVDASTTVMGTAHPGTPGGTIYPGGKLLIPNGDDVTMDITAYTNYVLDHVMWNGTNIGAVSSVSITDVTGNHTVQAVFEYTGVKETAYGVPYEWMDTYGFNYTTDQFGDFDNDGLLNWEEYVSGTHPKDSNSVFRVLDVYFGGTSNRVTFMGGGVAGATNNFTMLRNTNNLPNVTADNWDKLDINLIPRDPSGTNVWWDAAPPAGPAYYQPAVMWQAK